MLTAMALDVSNNVIVTGSALTIKYDTNGNQLWTAPYAGTALAVDSNANIYVCGYSQNFATVKLTPQGSNVWVRDYVDVGPTVSQAVLVGGNTNVYVAGSDTWICQESRCHEQLLLIKYDENGNQLWTATYNPGGSISSVHIGGVALDYANNAYLVASFTGIPMGYGTFEYSSSGNLLWSANPSYNGSSEAKGLVLDHRGSTVVTGMAKNLSFSYQYGAFEISAIGTILWTNYYPTPPTASSVANSIALDTANNTYATGYSPGTNSSNDIVTIKYGPSGNQIWLQRYNGSGNGNDAGNAIAVDANGNVYVAGYDTASSGSTEMVLIKYSPVVLQLQPNGTVILQAQGLPGESFDIQASEDLLHWLDLGNFLADTNGLMQFDDTNAPQYNARFYITNPQ
jgi:hypothetical protein